MRKTYGLTDQTFQALVGHEAEIADEMSCNASYIYGIKNGHESDPYARFRPLFLATVRRGGGHEHWTNDMAAILAGQRPAKPVGTLSEILLDKIRVDSGLTADILESLSDGKLSEREIRSILKGIESARLNLDAAEATLLAHLSELRTGEWEKSQ